MIRLLIISAVVLTSAACENKASSARKDALSSNGEAPPAVSSAATVEANGTPPSEADAYSGMSKVDPDPVPVSAPEIVSKETISVMGEPACVITVRYPDAIDQEAVWNCARCDQLRISIMDPARLRNVGQLDDLPAEARLDIERSTKGILVVESEFAAAAYPLNVFDILYEVPYAD